MGDMLVRLYALPDHSALVARLQAEGIEIRRALPPEKPVIIEWVRTTFSAAWAAECERAIGRDPVSCLIATHEVQLVGFACYDATCRGFFGPLGVADTMRRHGIGTALVWTAMRAMREEGYGYAVIGWTSLHTFYERACGAVPISASEPGIYRGMLKARPGS